MPRLHNANHEKMAQAYAKEAIKSEGKVNNTKIYQKVYKGVTPLTARSEASVVLARPSVAQRINEIIALKNRPEEISEDLANLRQANKEVFAPNGQIVEVRDNATRLGAVQTCLRVAGAFGQDVQQDNRQITFNLGSPNNIDNKGSNDNLGGLGLLTQAVDKLASLTNKLRLDRETA